MDSKYIGRQPHLYYGTPNRINNWAIDGAATLEYAM